VFDMVVTILSFRVCRLVWYIRFHNDGDKFLTTFGNEFPEIFVSWRKKEKLILS
jgi:hypothetical protein